jgi:hypothetical protein
MRRVLYSVIHLARKGVKHACRQSGRACFHLSALDSPWGFGYTLALFSD